MLYLNPMYTSVRSPFRGTLATLPDFMPNMKEQLPENDWTKSLPPSDAYKAMLEFHGRIVEQASSEWDKSRVRAEVKRVQGCHSIDIFTCGEAEQV